MKEGILLVEHFFPRKFGLPGGRIERGENPEDAVKRELMEETGLVAKNVKYLFECKYWHHYHKVFTMEAEGDIKINWELVGYSFLAKVPKSKIGASTKVVLEKYFKGKGF